MHGSAGDVEIGAGKRILVPINGMCARCLPFHN